MIYQHNNELRTTLLHDETAVMLLKNILQQMETEEFGKRQGILQRFRCTHVLPDSWK